MAARPSIARQIVGILARRIVCRAREGDPVNAGDRFGVMKFGSRMDVFVPAGSTIHTKVGDKVNGGVTVLATLPPPRSALRDMPMSGDARASSAESAETAASAPRRARAPVPARRLPAAEHVHDGEHVLRLRLHRPCDARRVRAGGAVHRLRHRARHARRPHRPDDRNDQRLRTRVRLARRRRVVRRRTRHPLVPWGLQPLGRIGWAAGFLFVAAAAVRLARFNIQAGTQDKRYFVGMPSPAAACVPAATVFAYPGGFPERHSRRGRAGDGARSGAADGEHDPFPQLQDARPAVASKLPGAAARRARSGPPRRQPQYLLVALAYAYLASGVRRLAWTRLRRRPVAGGRGAAAAPSWKSIATRRHSRRRRRSVTSTVVPLSRSLVTAIVPPLSSTFRFAIGSPSPVPVALVEKYGSKARASASASIPTPVSETRMRTRAAVLTRHARSACPRSAWRGARSRRCS